MNIMQILPQNVSWYDSLDNWGMNGYKFSVYVASRGPTFCRSEPEIAEELVPLYVCINNLLQVLVEKYVDENWEAESTAKHQQSW